MYETVLILDFGGQYKELIARRVRECGVYSVIRPGNIAVDDVLEYKPVGMILTGGPQSVYKADAPKCDKRLFELGVPVLGICYGMQLMSSLLGGVIQPCRVSEYGKTKMDVDTLCPLFSGLDSVQTGLMSHTDSVVVLPDGFTAVASTRNCPNAAVCDPERRLFGVQFHPEVNSTPNGTEIIRNFLFNICMVKGDYDVRGIIPRLIDEAREQVGDSHVILGLSGGVDSSVCAALLSQALPGRLHCIFVDHGLMRKNEGDEVEAAFSGMDLDFIRVNAGERFLAALKGASEPEKKRKIIGSMFVKEFESAAHMIGEKCFLAQGTIYPDVIESGGNKAAVIKSHHNVGGLPKNLGFTGVVEPLKGLFKDEVRLIGRQLGLPDSLVSRQPFPGPGLGVRIMGEITTEKIEILQNSDFIFREEMKKSRVKADQFFAVLTDTFSVGVVGDFRTYDYVVALRAVKTTDFMTCEYVPIPHRLLNRIALRIVNEVKGAGRVVYDITGKPPATIEWE